MKKILIIFALILFAVNGYAADTKISALDDGAGSIATTDIVPIVRSGANYRVTIANIFSLLAAPPAIGGTTPAAGKFTTLSAGNTGFTVDADGDVVAKSFTATRVAGTATSLTLYEVPANGDNYVLVKPADSLAADYTVTLPSATGTLAILGANTFTALQTYDATAGIQVGSTGVLITSDNDGAITFTGASTGYDEDLTLNFDDTENTVVFSSSTGVTKLDFSALNLATTGTISGATPSTTDANGMTISAAQAYGYIHWATGAGTWNLPAAAAGMSLCVYSTTAAAVVINPDDSDVIVLNGTALSAGDSITSASGAGDFVCLIARDAEYWHTMGRSGTWTDSN
jgi:hypothetical protein